MLDDLIDAVTHPFRSSDDASSRARPRKTVDFDIAVAAGRRAYEDGKADAERNQLLVLADIRAAVGDTGQMMQDELVEFVTMLRADAERYRWLRDRAAVKGFNIVTFTYAIGIPQGSSEDGFKTIPAEQLDAAIDAAMTKDAGK